MLMLPVSISEEKDCRAGVVFCLGEGGAVLTQRTTGAGPGGPRLPMLGGPPVPARRTTGADFGGPAKP